VALASPRRNAGGSCLRRGLIPVSDPVIPDPPLTAIFKISTGEYFGSDGGLIGTGYAGAAPHINDPSACGLQDVGPLPMGLYSIGAPIDDPNTGPFSLPLTPDPSNDMMGRSAFLNHGGLAPSPAYPDERVDSPSVTPGGTRRASHGCPIAARAIREVIAQHAYIRVTA
jgi:hypothetical protein